MAKEIDLEPSGDLVILLFPEGVISAPALAIVPAQYLTTTAKTLPTSTVSSATSTVYLLHSVYGFWKAIEARDS